MNVNSAGMIRGSSLSSTGSREMALASHSTKAHSPGPTPVGNPFSKDIPPDMAMLLQNLEDDFNVHQTIDQWTYINKREEIMQSVSKMHEQQQRNIELESAQFEKPLSPRKPSLLESQKFTSDHLLQVLARRLEIYKSDLAFLVLDVRGKEISSISWEKLYLKSLKIAFEIKSKLNMKRSDTVVLFFKDGEVTEFTIALFACFFAGVTAIPIHQDVSVQEVVEIVNWNKSPLLLYTDTVAKELDRLTSSNVKLQWPSKLIKMRTTDFGSAKKTELSFWSKQKRTLSSEFAYVEYSRSPMGELRGVSMTFDTLLHQLTCLNSTLLSAPQVGAGLVRSERTYSRNKNVILATLDLRCAVGLIAGIFFNVFSGNLLIWAPHKVMEIQGLYANIISRFKASILLGDYIGLKRVTYDYQQEPNSTRFFSKTQKVDFSSVKLALIDALTIDGEFLDILPQRFLRPLGCLKPENAVVPMLTLNEYGGMTIAMRDWLGSENSEDKDDGSNLTALWIDRSAISNNTLKIIDDHPSTDEAPQDALRVDAFGYPIPDANLVVVNPELSIVAVKGEIGEIWIDSPSLPFGFHGLFQGSKQIFHAKCRDASGILERDFLRTGLLGFTHKGKLYILGLYEDRIRQKISWLDQKIYKQLNKELNLFNSTTYYYSSHLLETLAKEVRQIYDCTIFDVFIGNEYLPVAIVEAEILKAYDESDQNSIAGSKTSKSGDSEGARSRAAVPLNEPVLNIIAQKCFDALFKRHYLRLYCVVVVDCDTLPKIMRSGGREIANMLCKKKFLEGNLRGEFVKFFVRKSISMIPHGEDIIGGIWSPYASELRSMALSGFPPQTSAFDYRDGSTDERTRTPLSEFSSIIDILKLRVAKQGEALAFQTIEHGGKITSKPLTWKKFEQRVQAVSQYLVEKSNLKAGQHVILMYALSEEFVIAVYACLLCGVIPIPLLPFDSNRIGEDFPAFVGIIRDFRVQDILVNEEVEKFLKNGPIADQLKKLASKRYNIKMKNTTKLTKPSNSSSLMSKITRFLSSLRSSSESIALVLVNFTSDHYRVAATMTQKEILGVCQIFKETCLMSFKHPVFGCVRHSSGIGFFQAAILGVYLGTTTYLISPVSFAGNPMEFFSLLSRYKVKDVFVTEQMLKYMAIKQVPKGFSLSGLRNMMVTCDFRVEVDFLPKIARVFHQTNLSPAALSTVYNHSFNPFIATRSYMKVAPVSLYLDPIALRQGYVSVVNQAEVPNALHIQDSGIVPVSTHIAVVNPETCTVCREGEFGEIWVSSIGNSHTFTNGPNGPVDNFINEQFHGKLPGDTKDRTYLRTGDLGFLHNVSIARNKGDSHEGGLATFKPLFLLGRISDSFEVMGLHHFPIDIENTVESCHADILRNGSCIFKCDNYTIIVCESKRSRYLASLVPLIVNTVLSKHHIIIDIVVFIKKGEFPISRLGTKQRARIIDAWVQAVLPVVASYGINYGENSTIKLVKEIELVAKDDPITGLKNPAMFYDDDDSSFKSPFDYLGAKLQLNDSATK